MNYDFLQSYNIPVRADTSNNQYVDPIQSSMEGSSYGTYSMQSTQSTPAVNTAYYGYGDSSTYNNSYLSGNGNSGEYYHNPERFIPPSKYGGGYVPHKFSFKRKINGGGGGSAAKKEAPIAEISSDGKLVIFMGRDESYPDELNSLIHPLSCDLCNMKMNSRAFAKDHYESKAHDKHVSAWLFKTYTEKGVDPPLIKRFVKQGPTGPNAFYCEACDLKLTSSPHASQHYAGKKHRLVIAQRAKPSGTGFYNSEGKWVRTGTKMTPNAYKDNRFGIGDTFMSTESQASTDNQTSSTSEIVSSVADTTTTTDSAVKSNDVVTTKKQKVSTNLEQDPTLVCTICKIGVTSAVQMTMHLSGSKHMKKLKSAGLNPTSIDNNVESAMDIVPPAAISDNVLLSAIKQEIKPNQPDLSMYRTPSGQYYCKTCNTSMSHLSGLEQHLMGKRHLKTQAEEKAMASLAKKN